MAYESPRVGKCEWQREASDHKAAQAAGADKRGISVPQRELEADFSRRPGVLPAHEDKLMNLGYARASDLGLPLTETGKDRIQKGR